MNREKILITGASGFIGKILLEHLSVKNYDITITSRNLKDLVELKSHFPSISIFSGDLMDIIFVNSIIKDKDIIYHLAGFKFVNKSETNIMESVIGNICITNNILNSVSLLRNKVRIKIISTNKTINIKGIYGATKFISERLAVDFEKKFDNIQIDIVYLTNVFNSPGSIGDIWKGNIINNRSIIITNPNCTRFFLTHKQAILILESDKINLDEVKSLKLSDLLEALILKYNKNFDRTLITQIGLNESEDMHEFFPSKPLPSNLNQKYSLEEIYELI